MKYTIYGNGSAKNHGCEAILRGTVELIGKDNEYIVQSVGVDDDIKYGLNGLAELEYAKKPSKKGLRFLLSYIKLKILGSYTDMDGMAYVSAIESVANKSNVAISVGGDNYCYSGAEIYSWLNREYQKNGFKTVLWGCSIEPVVVKEIEADLKKYNLIVARESITYEAVKKVNSNVILAPDPAFSMAATECDLDSNFFDKKTIGLNISPMIVANESCNGITYENYKCLIKYILNNTDYSIALIPHVVWETNDDRTVLRKLYEDFNCDTRLLLVEDHNAPELKYIISKCKLFIGARTHATIAAYSSCVPTLVVGYSVKARGIARDLFGVEENYVLPVQSLIESTQLTEGFKWLDEHETDIRSHLKDFLPEYLKSAQKAVDAIKELE